MDPLKKLVEYLTLVPSNERKKNMENYGVKSEI